MNGRPALAASLAFGVVVFAGACAGGPKHISEITPAVTATLSGAWVLNEQESDDPGQAMAAGRPARGDAGPGGERPPGGGMPPGGGGGMPGRGGMGGGRPGMGRPGGGRTGGSGNAAALQELRRLTMVPPHHLDLTLSDSAVAVTYPREEPWLLPFGKGVKRKAEEDVQVEGKAEWKDGLLSVTRQVSGAGSVKETFYPSASGQRLTVDVQFTMGQMGQVEFRRVYESEGASGSAPPH